MGPGRSGPPSAAGDLPAIVPRETATAASLLDLCCHHDDEAVVASWTRDELRSQMLAFDLRSWGVSPGARIALLLPNGVHNAVALLAAMNRYCVVALSPTVPAQSQAQSVHRAGACCLVTMGARLADTAAAVASAAGVPLVRLEDASEPVGSFTVPAGDTEPPPGEHPLMDWGGTILLLHTSGTTSAGKRVPFALRRLVASGEALAASLQLGPDDCGLNMMPMHHVGGIACNLFAPLLARSRMLFAPGFDGEKWHAEVHRRSPPIIAWSYAVPTMWSIILQHCERTGRALPPTLRLLRSGAAHMPHDVALRLAGLLGPHGCFLPTFSMTECMPIASPPVGYALDRPGSVGMPLGIRVLVLDSASDVVPVGQVGEVSLAHSAQGHDQLFNGYDAADPDEPLKQPGVPMRLPLSLPFRTGDLGRVDENGWLFHTGRSKECINRGGELLSPAQIEAVLCEHPLVDEVMAFSSPHDELGTRCDSTVG